MRFLGKIWDKTGMRFNKSRVPAGEHPMVVKWRGLERATTVLIKKDQRTIVNVNFVEGEEPLVVSYEPLKR